MTWSAMQKKWKRVIASAALLAVAGPAAAWFVGCGGGGGGGRFGGPPVYSQVFTRQEMFAIALTQELDRSWELGSGSFTLTLTKYDDGWNPPVFTVYLGDYYNPLSPITKLIEVVQDRVTFFNGPFTSTNGGSVYADTGAIITGNVYYNGYLLFASGSYMQPSIGLDSTGYPYFPITYGVTSSSSSFFSSFDGWGRAVDDFFIPQFSSAPLMQLYTTGQGSTYDDGEIIADNKIYGTFSLDYNSSTLPDTATVNLVEYPIPLFF